MNQVSMPISQLATVQSGGGAPQEAAAFTRTGFPFVRAGSLPKLLEGAEEESLELIEPEVADEYGLKLFPAGTVLFAKSGMSATKGHVCRLRNPAYVVNHLAALVPHEPSDSAFLAHALQRYSPTILIKDPAYPSIRLGDIESMTIQAPSSPRERERIAEILNKADSLRARRRAALAQVDTLTRSIFLDMFGDPLANAKGWKTCLMEEVATKITDGTHKTPVYTGGGVEFLSAKDLKDGGIAWGTGKFISEEEHRELVRRCNPEIGDILLAKSGSLGSVAVIDRAHQFSLFESLCLIKHDRDRVDGQFLTTLLRVPSMLAYLLGKNKGVAIKHLHLVDVRSLRIPIPPMLQQREFSRRATAAANLKGVQRKTLAVLDALFFSLQDRAFRGELGS